MSIGGRRRIVRLLSACALAAFAFSVHVADAAAVSFLTIDDVTRNEGNGGTTAFVFTVRLSNPPPPPPNVMVNYATGGGTATPGSCAGGADYIPTTGQLTFNPQQLTRTITVQVCGDTGFESTETFLVNLFNEPFGVIVTRRQGIGTIVNTTSRLCVRPAQPSAAPR